MTTLVLQPAEGIDNWIRSGYGNKGTDTTLTIGNGNDANNYTTRTLIKFDLSTLPDNAIISSATLSLFCNGDFSSNARTFKVYRVLRAWVESQSTWLIWKTGSNWGTAGAFGADDCEQTAIGSRDFTATETINAAKDFVLTPTTKSGLDLGNGWLIKADTEEDDAYQFASSDSAVEAQRPKLTIVYTLPATATGMIVLRAGRRMVL